MGNRKIPAFANESDEAQWWFDHRAETAADLVEASKERRPGQQILSRRMKRLQEIARADATTVRNDVVRFLAAVDPNLGSHRLLFVASQNQTGTTITYRVNAIGGRFSTIGTRRRYYSTCA